MCIGSMSTFFWIRKAANEYLRLDTFDNECLDKKEGVANP